MIAAVIQTVIQCNSSGAAAAAATDIKHDVNAAVHSLMIVYEMSLSVFVLKDMLLLLFISQTTGNAYLMRRKSMITSY
jgi:hypothetical protein